MSKLNSTKFYIFQMSKRFSKSLGNSPSVRAKARGRKIVRQGYARLSRLMSLSRSFKISKYFNNFGTLYSIAGMSNWNESFHYAAIYFYFLPIISLC